MAAALLLLAASGCAGGPNEDQASAPTSPGTPPGEMASRCDPAEPTMASVQHGTVAVHGGTTVGVPIQAVVPSRAFLLFSARGANERPVGVQVRGRLAAETLVEFERSTDEATPSPLIVAWSVVEYACGVHVQRGAASLETVLTAIPLGPVDLSSSFVTWSMTSLPTSIYWDVDDAPVVQLSSPRSLEVRVGHAKGHRLWWQVVQFEDPRAAKVQVLNTAMIGSQTTVSLGLAAPVDPARTFVLASGTSNAWETDADIGRQLVTATLTGPSTVLVERGAPGGAAGIDMPDILVQVVELRRGASVRSGSSTFAAGIEEIFVGLPDVDPSRSSVFLAGLGSSGSSVGVTPYVATDDPGVALFTAVLQRAGFVLTRGNPAADARVDWSLVVWG